MNRLAKSLSSLLAALGLCLLFAVSGACAQNETETLIRTPIEDATFVDAFPGGAVFVIRGGADLGVPTDHVARLDAGVVIPNHIHSGDYRAAIVSGNYQHWEDGDADQGPVLKAGSTYFQAGGLPHYDACLGPESCLLYIYFPEREDTEFVPPRNSK